jgi:hypothetical protein
LPTAVTIEVTANKANTVTSENRSTDPTVTSGRGAVSRSTDAGPLRRWIVQVVHDNPTFVSSLLYLYVTGTGILYSFILYRQFRINIFDYSEIGDFLLAGLRNPLALLFVAFQIGLLLLLIAITNPRPSQGIVRGSDEAGTRNVRRMTVPFVLLIIFGGSVGSIGLPILSAGRVAQDIKDGGQTSVQVRYSSSSDPADQVTKPGLELIGATQKVVFFYEVNDKHDEKDNHTLVIPQSRIISIEVPDRE